MTKVIKLSYDLINRKNLLAEGKQNTNKQLIWKKIKLFNKYNISFIIAAIINHIFIVGNKDI